MALLKLPDGKTRLLPIGQQIGDLILRSVTATEAVFFSSAGSSVTMRIAASEASLPASVPAPAKANAITAQAPARMSLPSPAPVVPSRKVAAPIDPPEPVRPVLVDIVMKDSVAMALLKFPDGKTRLLPIGQQVGDLILRSITATEAVFFSSEGSRVTMRIAPKDTNP